MEHCFLIRLPADGGRGEVRALPPQHCSLSQSPAAQMSPAEGWRSLRKTRPWPDRGSPGTRVREQLLQGGGRAPLTLCRAGASGASGSGHALVCSYACAYASASPGLHAGDSGDMRGSGVLWEMWLLFTHHSSFSISQLPPTAHKSPRRREGDKGIPFSPLSCALTQGYRPDLPGTRRGAFRRICDRHGSWRRGGRGMAGLRGACAGKTVRREAQGDPPQRRDGSGKGAEGRSPPSGETVRKLA